jgi:hypothetical protein
MLQKNSLKRGEMARGELVAKRGLRLLDCYNVTHLSFGPNNIISQYNAILPCKNRNMQVELG